MACRVISDQLDGCEQRYGTPPSDDLPPAILMMGLPVLVIAMSWRLREGTWLKGFARAAPERHRAFEGVVRRLIVCGMDSTGVVVSVSLSLSLSPVVDAAG